MVIRRAQHLGVTNGHLVLAVAQLGVVLLDGDALRLQRRHQRASERRGLGHRDRGEAQRVVERHIAAVLLAAAERELGLHRGVQRVAMRCGTLAHTLQERARASAPRRSVAGEHVAGHGRAVRRVGQQHEAIRIGQQTNFADRPHTLHRLELIEAVHRHHRHRQADPIRQATTQPAKRGGLAANRAAVVAVQEAHQPYASVVRLLDDVFGCHLILPVSSKQ